MTKKLNIFLVHIHILGREMDFLIWIQIIIMEDLVMGNSDCPLINESALSVASPPMGTTISASSCSLRSASRASSSANAVLSVVGSSKEAAASVPTPAPRPPLVLEPSPQHARVRRLRAPPTPPAPDRPALPASANKTASKSASTSAAAGPALRGLEFGIVGGCPQDQPTLTQGGRVPATVGPPARPAASPVSLFQVKLVRCLDAQIRRAKFLQTLATSLSPSCELT